MDMPGRFAFLKLRIRFFVLRFAQLAGFVLVGIGAYPIYRPFLRHFWTAPEIADRFVARFGVPVFLFDTATSPAREFGQVDVVSVRSAPAIAVIALGLVVIWLTTSSRI